MIRIIAMSTAGLLAASVAQAQTAPPPGNVNPGSLKSGQEQSGAPNQPRSNNSSNSGAIKGTTGSGISAPTPSGGAARDGSNANVKPSSPEADIPAGEPANQPR